MNPEKYGISTYDIDDNFQEQATQTISVSVDNFSVTESKRSLRTYSRLPLPRDLENKDDTITIYEYCHVLQDFDTPQSVTIIKEKITENKRDQPSNSCADDKDCNKCRYSYCKEIIKPFLKYPPGCPISDERIYICSSNNTDDLTPLISATVNTQETSAQTIDSYYYPISRVDIATSCGLLKMDSEKVFVSTTTSSTDYNEKAKEEEIKTENVTTKPNVNTENPDETMNIKADKPGDLKAPLSLDIINPPSQWSFFRRKVSQEQKEDKEEKQEKANTSTTEKEKPESEDNQETKSNIETPEAAPSRMLSTVSVIKNFVGKVYNKDPVVSPSEIEEKEIKKEELQMNIEDNTLDAPPEPKESFVDRFPVIEALNNALDKVDSTMSTFSDQISKSYDLIPKSLKLKSFNNVSSPFDVPAKPSNQEIAAPTEQPTEPSSVFSTIKSKLCSMFYESPTKSASSSQRSMEEGKDKGGTAIDN